MDVLRELVGLARVTPSARNVQPLRYILVCDPQVNAGIFSTLAWAGYLKDWDGPVEGERPAAYVVVLGDTTLGQSFGADEGIAVQTMLLGAVERGFGGCMLGSIQRDASTHAARHPGTLRNPAGRRPGQAQRDGRAGRSRRRWRHQVLA